MPRGAGPEFAVVGRSNVGKSSFLNHIFSQRKLAYVSKKPGKTKLANFFRCDDGTVWVDLPGYGYAEAGRGEKRGWSSLIAGYCGGRESLAGVIWLLDSRHPGVAADVHAAAWLARLAVPVLAVLTKTDKLSKAQCIRHAAEFARVFRFAAEPVFFTIRSGLARREFWSRFDRWRADAAR
jgi:GTP-binding protein